MYVYIYTLSRYKQIIYRVKAKKNSKTTKNMDDGNFEDFVGSTKNKNWWPYLLTYSLAGIRKFPDSSTFSECILYAFTKVKIWGLSQNELVYIKVYTDGGKNYHITLNVR